MGDNIKFCKCGFKGVEGMFNKTDGACPVCGKGVLTGAENKTREQLEAIKKDLPRRGQ